MASSTNNAAMTGDGSPIFVNGKLFPYLHGFKLKATGPNTIEYKIGEIFGEIKNKISSGYNMREVIVHIDETALPLPDGEQQRIVRILDETFVGIATAKANGRKEPSNASRPLESHLESVFTQRRRGVGPRSIGWTCANYFKACA